jgi:hypothetical protein
MTVQKYQKLFTPTKGVKFCKVILVVLAAANHFTPLDDGWFLFQRQSE